MSREKKFGKKYCNFGYWTIKLKDFYFLLLPVYTSLLSPDDFGTIDALQTVISLALYFVTLQIENAVFRFIIENRTNKENQISYVTSAGVVLLAMAGTSTIVIGVINFLYMIPYVILVTLSLWTQSLYLFVSNLARGLGKNTDYSITSFAVTVSSLIINIVLIVDLKIGAVAILVALAFSNLIGFCWLFLRLHIWQLIKFSTVNKMKIQEMLRYSLPLIPNAIFRWLRIPQTD